MKENTKSAFPEYTTKSGKLFAELLSKQIVMLDGAMGTMIQKHKLEEADFRGGRFADHPSHLKGNNDLLVLTRPQLIQQIHEEFLAAGADIIETNTFSSTTISQADYGLEPLVHELNVEAAKLAHSAVANILTADPSRTLFVAGFAQSRKNMRLDDGGESGLKHAGIRDASHDRGRQKSDCGDRGGHAMPEELPLRRNGVWAALPRKGHRT